MRLGRRFQPNEGDFLEEWHDIYQDEVEIKADTSEEV